MKIIKTTLVILPPLLTVAAILLAILKQEGKLDKYLKTPPTRDRPPIIGQELDFSVADDDESPDALTPPTAKVNASQSPDPPTISETEPEKAPSPPTLTQAEQNILKLAQALSELPLWHKCLAQTTPIQRFVGAIDAIALGKRPLESLDFLRPDQPFTALKQNQVYHLSPQSQERFREAVNFFCSLSPAAVAQLYILLEPACQEALEKRGYRDQPFRELLTTACTTILLAPIPQEEPVLIRTANENIFLWQQPELEQLNEAQKLFLRLGRKNATALRRQLENIADQLHLYQQETTTGTP